MGGSSIWFTSIAIGIILSVSREVEEEIEAEKNEKTTNDLKQPDHVLA
jgi:hypothetical protein